LDDSQGFGFPFVLAGGDWEEGFKNKERGDLFFINNDLNKRDRAEGGRGKLEELDRPDKAVLITENPLEALFIKPYFPRALVIVPFLSDDIKFLERFVRGKNIYLAYDGNTVWGQKKTRWIKKNFEKINYLGVRGGFGEFYKAIGLRRAV
jgi:hypothetical protein